MAITDQSIPLKLQEHDIRLNAIDRIMTESVTEQKQLVRELHELTSSFKVYIERHDQVNEASRRLWTIVDAQQKEISELKDFVSASEPMIEGLRGINSKLVWMVISALGSPAVMIGAYALLKGGSL
jgi:predicted transcriptional regulator